MEMLLAPMEQSSSIDFKLKIQKALTGGAIKKTLDVRIATLQYRKTGKLRDKEIEILAAYKEIADSQDEVRRDVATGDFLWIANERKDWAALERLLGELHEDCHIRQSFSGELKNAIEMGLYRPGKP